MIGYDDGIFVLENRQFSYILRIANHGQPEFLHFGAKLTAADWQALAVKPGIGWGSSVQYDADGTCLDVLPLDWSGSGRGDYRESPLQWSLGASDFTYASHRIVDGIVPMSGGLPQAQDGLQTLEITLTDPRGFKLLLYYTLFETALTRRTVLVNESGNAVSVNKLMSFSADLPGKYELTTFLQPSPAGLSAQRARCHPGAWPCLRLQSDLFRQPLRFLPALLAGPDPGDAGDQPQGSLLGIGRWGVL